MPCSLGNDRSPVASDVLIAGQRWTPAVTSDALAGRRVKKQNISETSLESESSQKLLFYLLEKIDKLDAKLDDRIDKLNSRIDKLNIKIDSRFLWRTGIMFTGFIEIITIIFSKI